MSNQTSGFSPPRINGVGVQPPGDTGVPNQSSSFAKKVGIQIVREVDGSPSIFPVTILEVPNSSLTNPAPGVARITTFGTSIAAGVFAFIDYAPTDGQTVFVIPDTPGNVVLFVLNGQVFYSGTAFTVVGTTITWLNPAGIVIDTSDKIRIYYSSVTDFDTVDFVPTAGQTIFALPSTPGGTVIVVLNGQLFYPPTSFSVVGTTLTWLEAGGIVLDPDDKMRVFF